MKRLATLALALLLLGAIGTIKPVKAQETLTVYSYTSITPWMKQIIPIFEKEYGVKVNLVTVGDAGEVLNRLILEKDNPQADVVVGIDNSYLQKAIQAGILEPYKPSDVNVIPKWIIDDFDPTFHLTPYDYGAIAIVYKKSVVKNPPKTFKDLTKPEWKGKLIVEDPRTSSTGMAFLLWTIGAYGNKWLDYWAKLRENKVIVVKSWDAGWEMWDKNQAPLFVSYATDPAYDACEDKNVPPKIGAVFLNGTAYVQIEGAGIIKGAKHPELAKKFIDFLISKEAQEKLPTTQWMYPVNRYVKPPACFNYALNVTNPVKLSPDEIGQNYKKWLEQWTALMVEGKSPEEITGTSTTTTTPTGSTSTTSSGGGICGPALIVALAALPLLLRKRR
ncbi:thiamine ABC transporter substrate binding subunit [Thermococcus sp.]|uniref:thiamine ABC transporter substrate-binding protein n=1 Tax=Thermococcus sp. TaxID=35749 RepID=UPI0026272573|nr:thiamine ABC transporter substrate binding subunit [Thermococcus sp.]